MPSGTKFVYRDNMTGRLITRKEAESRDPSTYTVEEFDRKDPPAERLERDDVATAEDQNGD